MASRSAAAEARRRKILERGTDRLNRITVGNSTGLAGVEEQPRGLGEPLIASPASINADKQHADAPKTLQEPAVPLKDADQEPTSDAVNVRSGAAQTSKVQPKEQKDLLGGAGSYVQEGRQKPAQHALPGASHKWAQYESSSALPGQQSPLAKPLTPLQALSAAVQLVHSWQIAMALIMPLLTKWAAAGCALGGASRWQSMQCSLANAPLLHLLLWHTLLIAAAVVYVTAAGHSRSVKGSAAATGLLASQPVRMLVGMMGAQQAVVRLEAGLCVVNSLVDALAVYTLMAALTCTVELQLGSRAWFNRASHKALPVT